MERCIEASDVLEDNIKRLSLTHFDIRVLLGYTIPNTKIFHFLSQNIGE